MPPPWREEKRYGTAQIEHADFTALQSFTSTLTQGGKPIISGSKRLFPPLQGYRAMVKEGFASVAAPAPRRGESPVAASPSGAQIRVAAIGLSLLLWSAIIYGTGRLF